MSIKAMMATILQNRLASRGVHSLTPSDYEEIVDTMIEQLTELELSLGQTPPNVSLSIDPNGRLLGLARRTLICWPQHHNLCLEVARDRIGSITVEANTLIAPVHDRMPAIVESKDFKRWMGPKEDPHAARLSRQAPTKANV